MKKYEQWIWIQKKKMTTFWYSSYKKNVFNKISIGASALLIGLIISSFFLWANLTNPGLFFTKAFKYAFHPLSYDLTLTKMSLYIICALVIAVSFKINFFNIGVVGQMLMSGALVLLLASNQTIYDQNGAPIGHKIQPTQLLFYTFLIAIFAGIFICVISGFLKAYFNINEVVTTIMLNYIVYYLARWIFEEHQTYFDINTESSKLIDPAYNLKIGGYQFVLPMILALLASTGLWIVYQKTTFGYRIDAIRHNTQAARLNGYSPQYYVMITTIITGFLAGLLGWLYYINIRQIPFSSNQLPSFGFEGIAISLIAFNHPIGIIFCGSLQGIFVRGADTARHLFHLSTYIIKITLSIILIVASILTGGYQWKIIERIRKKYCYYHATDYRQQNQQLKIKINNLQQKIQHHKQNKTWPPEYHLIKQYQNIIQQNKIAAYQQSYWLQKIQHKQQYQQKVSEIILTFLKKVALMKQQKSNNSVDLGKITTLITTTQAQLHFQKKQYQQFIKKNSK